MCHLCASAPARAPSRRRFLAQVAAGLVASSFSLWPRQARAAVPAVGWGRLITRSRFWNLHGEQDTIVAQYIQRETRLGMEPKAYAVDPANLEQLSSFPFLFSNDLTAVADAKALANLREYLRRGGFVYADGCIDHRLTRDFGDYLSDHASLFGQLLPGSALRRLPPAHAIFHTAQPVEESQLGLEPTNGFDHRWDRAAQALYGVFLQERLVSIVSLDHLYCEWLTRPEKIPFCLKEIANIYVYAMTR